MNAIPAEDADFGWLEERAGCGLGKKATAIKAIDESGKIHGMVGYDGWTKNSVSVHMAADNPMAWRCLLRVVFYYPFVQLDRKIAIGTAASDNEMALRVQKKLGFKEVHRVVNGWSDGVDLVVVELRRDSLEAQRWLNGQR